MVTPASIKKNNPLSLTIKNISKENILKELNKPYLNKSININNDFKLIMNGLFQAEGHIGGEFINNINSFKIRPIVFISLNASYESINLFRDLNNVFNNELSYLITKNKSGIYHIRIYTRNWNIIINKWIPYFNNCYGDKAIGLSILLKIYYILNINDFKFKNSNEYKLKLVYLLYNIIDNSQRELKLEETLLKFKIIDNKIYMNNYINNIKSNIKWPKMSLPFIFGMYLGDGTYYISIKYKNKGIQYIPTFKILQKYTKNNEILLKMFQEFLISYDIKSYVIHNKKYNKIYFFIESIKSIRLLKDLIYIYNIYAYNKLNQLNYLYKSCILFNKTKYWLNANLILLNLIYINQNLTEEKYNTYINNIKNHLNNTYYYISTSKKNIAGEAGTSLLDKKEYYIVNLPINIKPKSKYFTYGLNKKGILTKEQALIQAIEYRDNNLNKWLKDKGLL